MDVNYLCAGVAVADYDSALGWYQQLFGRPPDVLPKDGEAMWLLEGAGGVYIVGDAERAGRSLLALLVDDLDGLVAELSERRIPADQLGGTPPRVVITDPDGNRITVGQWAA